MSIRQSSPCDLFRSQREKVTRSWRKLCNEKFRNLSSSPTIMVIKTGKGRKCSTQGINKVFLQFSFFENLKGRNHFEAPDADERVGNITVKSVNCVHLSQHRGCRREQNIGAVNCTSAFSVLFLGEGRQECKTALERNIRHS